MRQNILVSVCLTLLVLFIGYTPTTPAGVVTVGCSEQSTHELIEALRLAHDDSQINLSPDCIYTLEHEQDGDGTALPPIEHHITINGQNATIERSASARRAFRLFSVRRDGVLHLDNVILSNGASESDGGGIAIDGGRVELLDSTLVGNMAHNDGGAIFVNDGSLHIDNCTLVGNSAEYFGGGIAVVQGVVSIVDSTIILNSAEFGGGFAAYESKMEFNNTTLFSNQAIYGGGVSLVSGELVLNGESVVSDNSAEEYGGGLVNYAGRVVLNDSSVVSDNHSAYVLNMYNSAGGTVALNSRNLVRNYDTSVRFD